MASEKATSPSPPRSVGSPAATRQRCSRRASGFSLTEVIGVLAILAILVSIITPSIIKRIKRAHSAKEDANLRTIGASLQREILRSKTIPNAGWAQLVGDELAIPLADVTTSVAGNPRVFLIDPNLHIGTGNLPFTQSQSGSVTPPSSARVMIISSQGEPLPASIVTGVAADSATFDNIWDASGGTAPVGWPPEWQNKGEVLHVFRLNLESLFHRLVISDITIGNAAVISVGGGAPFQIPAGGLSSYYLEGTVIEFHNDGAMESRDLLFGDRSYIYERRVWRGQLWEGKIKDASDLAKALDAFQSARANPSAASGATQAGLVDAYYNYVLNYATWSRAGFPSYDEFDQPTPEYQSLLNARDQVDGVSADLIFQ